MKTGRFCKYEPIAAHSTEGAIIGITETIPRMDNQSLIDAGIFYQQQAEGIVDLLFHSLPQGTFDRLWIEIMKKKMSFYMGKTEG